MHPSEQLLRNLFQAIDTHNVDAVVACYTEDATFEDIAFRLEGKEQIRAMWATLLKPLVNGLKCDLRVEVQSLEADDKIGSAYITDRYTFRETKRAVNNPIASGFQFRDGRVCTHIDNCDEVDWAEKAFGGFKGFVAGHVGPIRRWMAMQKLKREHPEAF